MVPVEKEGRNHENESQKPGPNRRPPHGHSHACILYPHSGLLVLMEIFDLTYDQARDGFRITLDDGSEVLVSYQTYMKKNLTRGMILSEDLVLALKKEDEMKQALFQAQHFLSYRPRTRFELEANLRKKKFQDPAIQSALEILESQGLIDEAAFAQAYAQEKSKLQKFSKKRILFDLQAKRLDPDVIDQALDAISEEDEYDKALALAKKHTRSRDLAAYKNRQRTYRYLMGKGFTYDLVKRVMDDLEKDS